MISIIVTGHGQFASGLLSAVETVFGPQSQTLAVDFPSGISTSDLDARLQAALASLPASGGVVFLTDLLGGSPFKLASQIALSCPQDSDVIAGANLSMFAEIATDRDGILTISDFIGRAEEAGRAGIVSLRARLARKPKAAEPTDGL